MIEAETILLYSAIAEMRELSLRNEPFSFIFATFDNHKKTSNGISVVNKAVLRKAATNEQVENSNYKLFYFDLELHEPRVCWQPLIMFFNGKKIDLQ